MKNIKIKKMIYLSLMTCILCVIAPISIPLGSIPLSFSTFIIYVIAAICTPYSSLVIIMIYIFIGIIGIPIFSFFSGGVGTVLGLTGGYILGYIPCIYLTSLIININNKKIVLYPIAMVIGTICCYLVGTLWYMYQSDTTFIASLSVCVLPFVIFDVIKIIIATIIGYFLNNEVVKKVIN